MGRPKVETATLLPKSLPVFDPGSGFGPNSDDRIINFSGDVSEETASAIIHQMFSLAKQSIEKPIYLVISTFGGSVYDMFGLYDAMNFVKAPVYTIGLGKIMSAGVLLLSSGQRGYRYIGDNATVMMHSVSGGSFGNVFEQEMQTQESMRLQKRIEECFSNETGQKIDKIKKLMNERTDHYMTAKEAITFGIADKIIGKCKKDRL